MSTIIKNGTIVTADLTYTSDIRVEDGKITEIGENSIWRYGAGRDRLLCDAGRDRSACAPGDALYGHLLFRRF